MFYKTCNNIGYLHVLWHLTLIRLTIILILIYWQILKCPVDLPELLIIGKYVKIRFRNMGSPCYFLSCEDRRVKGITKIEEKRLFLSTFLVSFFMAFLTNRLIYTIGIWFHFLCLSHFFEQNQLLNLIFLGGYMKKWPRCACISKQKLM